MHQDVNFRYEHAKWFFGNGDLITTSLDKEQEPVLIVGGPTTFELWKLVLTTQDNN